MPPEHAPRLPASTGRAAPGPPTPRPRRSIGRGPGDAAGSSPSPARVPEQPGPALPAVAAAPGPGPAGDAVAVPLQGRPPVRRPGGRLPRGLVRALDRATGDDRFDAEPAAQP